MMIYKDFNDLVKLAGKHNFVVTSTKGGRHNVGSKHYKGLAIDVRSRDKTAKQIADFIEVVRGEGLILRDERVRPRGQRVWGGAHLHIEIAGNPRTNLARNSILKKNSKDEEAVKTLQNRLVKLGFLKPKDIDGDFGDDTEKAVKAFQAKHNLEVDGEVGDDTKKKLTETLAALSLNTAETNPIEENFRVGEGALQGLFIRSAPVATEATKIAVLPMGQKVKKLTESTTPGWWQVSTNREGVEIIGFVSSRFLVVAKDFVAPKEVKGISPVHLHRTNPVTRKNTKWAFALNETEQPTRNATDSAANKAKSLTEIVKWLDVENVNHVRYKPIPNATYCNIYAYDYCLRAGVFLPRIWWTGKALIDLAAGKKVAPVYGETVLEMNANSLFNWLKEFGATFGWEKTASLEKLQNAANKGQIAIICAAHKKTNKSGHIVAVVPETNSHKAERRDGLVVKPLQSQAGRINRRYQTDLWWIRPSANLREHGFWINAA